MTSPEASSSSSQPSPLLQSQVLGRQVLDLHTAEDLGQVLEIWLDPQQHQVAGFACAMGPLGIRQRYFAWTQLESLGTAALMVSRGAGVERDKPQAVERALGDEVWTDRGDRIGTVVDYRINPETGDVVDYLFTSDAWGGLASGTYCLPAQAVVSMNATRLIAQAGAVANPERYTGNVTEQAAEFLQSDLHRTQQDVRSVVGGARAIADQLAQRTRSLTHRGKQRLSAAVEQTRDQRAELAQQAQERLSVTSRQLQDQASLVKGKLETTTQKLSADARKRFQRDQQNQQATAPSDDNSIDDLEQWDDEPSQAPRQDKP